MQSGHLRLALLMATRRIDSETYRVDAEDAALPTFDTAAWAAWAKAALTGGAAERQASTASPAPDEAVARRSGRIPGWVRF